MSHPTFKLIFLLAALTLTGCAAPHPTPRELDTLKEAPLHTFNEPELGTYLAWLHTQPLSTRQRVIRLARQTVGQPYRLSLLGEYPIERHDPDPMYCLSASDCVTFVEQTWAMALANDWSSFFDTLQRIRYKDGEVGILTRNHFTSADWNPNNAWLFTDATRLVGGDATTRMHVRVNRAAFFEKWGLGKAIPLETIMTDYIPREHIAERLAHMKDADIVEFVKGGHKWKYISHLGLLAHDKSGTVTLIHSTKPAVREEPLRPYIKNHPKIQGIKLLRQRH